jgi:hypothetical protein
MAVGESALWRAAEAPEIFFLEGLVHPTKAGEETWMRMTGEWHWAMRGQPPGIHRRRCPPGELAALLLLYAQKTRIAALRDMLMGPMLPITALPGTVTELQ